MNDVGGTEKQLEGAVERLDVDVMRPGTVRSEVDLQLQAPAHLDGERARGDGGLLAARVHSVDIDRWNGLSRIKV